MNLQTTRFGEIAVEEEKTIEMKDGGILGFEGLRRFALILHQEDKTPFLWLQSVEDGSIAFVVMNAFVAMPDYSPVIDDETADVLGIEGAQDAVLLAIVTIRTTPLRVTANLKAPIVIHAKRRCAKQVIIDEPDYPIQYDLALRAENSAASAASPILEAVKGITTAIAG